MTRDEPPRDDESDDDDEHLFGIDLGRRGDKEAIASRDEVEPPKPTPVRRLVRTLTERLASAKADRDEDSRQHAADKAESNDDEGPAEQR